MTRGRSLVLGAGLLFTTCAATTALTISALSNADGPGYAISGPLPGHPLNSGPGALTVPDQSSPSAAPTRGSGSGKAGVTRPGTTAGTAPGAATTGSGSSRAPLGPFAGPSAGSLPGISGLGNGFTLGGITSTIIPPKPGTILGGSKPPVSVPPVTLPVTVVPPPITVPVTLPGAGGLPGGVIVIPVLFIPPPVQPVAPGGTPVDGTNPGGSVSGSEGQVRALTPSVHTPPPTPDKPKGDEQPPVTTPAVVVSP
ncbi:MAG TPA: hypothetical protein VGN54_12835, partial [Mycobacteriales bacterium]|nr:hypothetical protein [Mycobacteriales bacterium]